MPYRVAADMLQHLLPIDAGTSPETLRGHTLQVGQQLSDAVAEKPPIAAAAITISLDSTFIRSREEGERNLEVRGGNVETVAGGRQVFGAVTRAETDITALTRRTLEMMRRTDTTEVTAFTDGCPGLGTVLANAGVTKPPILDWFHIAMRLQHTKLAAANLSIDDPGRVKAKAMIVAEVERLHWRIWNGKAKNAQRSIKRIRKVMQVFKGERSRGTKGVASRKLWHALHAIDKYLRGQAAWLVNYAKRYRAGERVGTSITEGTANFLVNRRMNKSQQMRWSRRGADLLLQVRCAVYNGTLGAGFGRRFDRIVDGDPALLKRHDPPRSLDGPEEAIHHLPFVDFASSATALGRRDQVLHMPPFLVGQVTWVTQLVPVIPRTVLSGPHHAFTNRFRRSNHSRVNGFKPLR